MPPACNLKYDYAWPDNDGRSVNARSPTQRYPFLQSKGAASVTPDSKKELLYFGQKNFSGIPGYFGDEHNH